MSRKLTRVRIADLVSYLMAGKRTKTQLARRIGISRTTASDWVNILHKAGCLHIAGYVQTKANGYRAAVYAWGKDDDAPRPRAMTSAERVRRVRDKSTLDRAWKPTIGV